jgi:hypothetical protein
VAYDHHVRATPVRVNQNGAHRIKAVRAVRVAGCRPNSSRSARPEILVVEILAVEKLAVEVLAVERLVVEIPVVEILVVEILAVEILAAEILAAEILTVEFLSCRSANQQSEVGVVPSEFAIQR